MTSAPQMDPVKVSAAGAAAAGAGVAGAAPKPFVVDFRGVTKEFQRGGQRFVALQDVSFVVEDLPNQGELISVLGQSGCGKSTLLRLIAGLEPHFPPTRGQVLVAGEPVTEWRLYDTHYTERYLGDPVQDEDAYDRSSLLHDAAKLERPLLLVHGLADDNVVAAHTLQLSSALTKSTLKRARCVYSISKKQPLPLRRAHPA